jgi:hypothetical protein
LRNGFNVVSVGERNPETKISTENSTELFNTEFSYGNRDVKLIRNLGIIRAVSETKETDTETNGGGEIKREEIRRITTFKKRFE